MSKIEKIMLAAPNDRWFENRHWNSFPYTFGVLTSVLKDRYDVKILDAGHEDLDFEKVRERIEKYGPDVFGITCMSLEYTQNIQKLASIAKSACPDTKVVAGGIYPTLLPDALIQNPNVDYEVLGEGEYRFPRLLKHLEGKLEIDKINGIVFKDNGKPKINPVEEYIEDLDQLPLPCYENLDLPEYASRANKYSYYAYPRRMPYAATVSSRGCPFRCIFCSSKSINGPKIRYRSADSVLKEIDMLVDKYKVKEIIFMDDNFYMDSERAHKIFSGLIERNYDLEWKSVNAAVYALDDRMLERMRQSKCYQISLAVESGTLEGLRRLKKPVSVLQKAKPIIKKARSLDFEVGAMFVIGTPGETWDEIRQTMRFAEEIDADYCSFNIATPLPKTELYEIAIRNNLLPKDFDFNSLDFKGFGRATITTDEFTPEELQILRAFEWDRINFKTREKAEKIARMNGLTLEELNAWRVSTRRGLGVKVRYS